jgi:hypothetical protein
LLLLLVIATGVVAVRLKNLVSSEVAEATLAKNELLDGVHLLKSAGMSLTPDQSIRVVSDFQKAEQHFAHLNAVLKHSRSIGLIQALPLAGNQVKASIALSDMGWHFARTGTMLVDALDTALASQPPSTAATKEGPGQKLLITMEALDPKLAGISLELDRAAADRQAVPSKGLVPQLSAAVAQLDAKVDLRSVRDEMKTLRAIEPAIREFLGESGARSYLVLQQDPAELRPTGGFIGSVGYLSFDKGKMAPFQPEDVYAIDRDANGIYGISRSSTHVPAPAPFVTTFHLNSWALRDSNWWPDFPTSARQAEFFLEKEAGRKVDGVIAIDPYLIQRLLAVLGPVTVPETGDVVDQKNFFSTTLYRVELNQGPGHKSFLSYAARAIFPKLLGTPSNKWPALLDALKWGCDAKSLQAYIHDAGAEAFVDRFGCGGELRSSTDDSLMVVDSNVGGNKDDFWLQRRFSLKIRVNSDGSAHHTLHLHYFGLTAHGFLTAQWGYTGWLRVYLPSSSSVTGINGVDFGQSKELDHRLLAGWLYVQFSHTADVTIDYDVPASVMRSADGQIHVLWQKQAGRQADSIGVELEPPGGWKLQSAKLGPVPVADGPVETDLSVDREFVFTYARTH